MFLLFWKNDRSDGSYQSVSQPHPGTEGKIQVSKILSYFFFFPMKAKPMQPLVPPLLFPILYFDVFHLFASLLDSLFWLMFLRMLNTHGICSHEAYTLGDNTG